MYDLKAREKSADEISHLTRKLAPYIIGDEWAVPVCTELSLWGLRPFLPLKIDKLEEVTIGIGGGFSGMGEVCGAISGHIIAIGVDLASRSYDTGYLRLEIARETRNFMRAFREKFGAVRCEELMGMSFMKTGNWEKYTKDIKLLKKCDEIVRFAIIYPLPSEMEK